MVKMPIIPAVNRPALKGGVGLRTKHYPAILQLIDDQRLTPVRWFEIISENYMSTQGRPRIVLEKIRQTFPIAMHGVGLSIGGAGVDLEYLSQLRKLERWLEPFIVSDHLCWTGVNGENVHDLLPLVYDQENLDRICGQVSQVQDYLQRPLLLENPSVYFEFQNSVMDEVEFLATICRRTGAQLLLDINNVYVNARNFGTAPENYIDRVDFNQVGQIHLAGHTATGKFLFDTHSIRTGISVGNFLQARLKSSQTSGDT